jgi:hypothetical protein
MMEQAYIRSRILFDDVFNDGATGIGRTIVNNDNFEKVPIKILIADASQTMTDILFHIIDRYNDGEYRCFHGV